MVKAQKRVDALHEELGSLTDHVVLAERGTVLATAQTELDDARGHVAGVGRTRRVRRSRSPNPAVGTTYPVTMSKHGTGWTAIGLAAVLTLAACGSSEGNAGGTDDFCEQIRVLDADESVADDNPAAAVDELEALIDDAPEEIRDDLRTVVDAFAEFDAIDEDDPDAFAVLFEIFERPEVIEASENLERFGVEECGLEPTPADEAERNDDTIEVAEPDVVATTMVPTR